jgi:membrane protein implicated in regulation of membrane protease activity
MEAYVYWFVLAFIFLVVEMATGTFYFLALSIAMALGGLAAQVGLGLAIQLAAAGGFAVIGTMGLRYLKKSRRTMPDLGPDIGQTVKVLAWNEDGSARVHYRGAEWDAEPESTGMARDGMLYIKAIQGSKLILTQHKTK